MRSRPTSTWGPTLTTSWVAKGARCGRRACSPVQPLPEPSVNRRRASTEDRGVVTTEFVLLYGVLLALVMSVIHFGLVFNASLAVADVADSVLEAVQVAGGSPVSAPAVAKTVVGDERLVRDLSTDVVIWDGEVTVAVSASAPRIVPGLPTAVSHRVQGPVERFIPEGRR